MKNLEKSDYQILITDNSIIQNFTFPFHQGNGILTESQSKVCPGCITKDHCKFVLYKLERGKNRYQHCLFPCMQ